MFSCKYCGKEFSTIQNCRKHELNNHENTKIYVCQICQKEFKSNSGLSAHMLTHFKQSDQFDPNIKLSQEQIDLLYLNCNSTANVCPICGSVKSRKWFRFHLFSEHNLCCSPEILKTLNLKICPTCGKRFISRGSECNSCAQLGDKNPCKNHIISEEEHELRSQKSKALWATSEYREKVISRATGKKRSLDFCRMQSIRTKQTYIDNPDLRLIKSIKMTESWDTGKLNPEKHISYNRSNRELEFINILKDKSGLNILQNQCVTNTYYVQNTGQNKWFFPDGLYKNIIIEFYGDYWHGKCDTKYSDTNAFTKISNQEQISRDKNRILQLEKLGYQVIVIWESDYNLNKDNEEFWTNLISDIKSKLN